MKAAVCEQYGPPEAVRITQVKKPSPGHSDVLVRVIASSVNSADARMRSRGIKGPMRLIRRMALGWTGPRNKIFGTVYAGIVDEVGADVTSFKPGERVFGCTGIKGGGHAEYVCVSEHSPIALMPKKASFSDAAALLFGGTAALSFLKKARSQKGGHVLIYGASGAVGSMAVQIAKRLKLKVTAVARRRQKERLSDLGADYFLDYLKPGFRLEDNKYDIIFDVVGKLKKQNAKRSLKPGGRFVTVASAYGIKESQAQLKQLAFWYDKGLIRAVIEHTYPLDDIVAAYREVDEGIKFGSIVLSVAPELIVPETIPEKELVFA